MPKCPNCQKEIDSVEIGEIREYSASVCLRQGTDILEYSDEEVHTSQYTADCPECSQEIAASSDEVKKFLKGEYDG